ncbi:hypothetical protein MRS44_012752 [Fusarium solani]|uniref:uncharacterized protein n=1 Tax=Fusarium solani TaxID=169388 RepID=UPI0032C44786|nr:hypothetical protein MRS44_012752 [Fusarium solani]
MRNAGAPQGGESLLAGTTGQRMPGSEPGRAKIFQGIDSRAGHFKGWWTSRWPVQHLRASSSPTSASKHAWTGSPIDSIDRATNQGVPVPGG